jgi:plastocyanin
MLSRLLTAARLTSPLSRGLALLALAALVGVVAWLATSGRSHGQPQEATSTEAATTALESTTTPAEGPRTIDVNEYEFGFTLSKDTIPAGKVTFVMRNTGGLMHNFDLVGGREGPFLGPGQTATMSVELKPGMYLYVCSVKYHAAQGMQGTLTVK